jgi:hypothetical protein
MSGVSAHGDLETLPPAEVRKEAYTMALYVAICLLAALAAVPDPIHGDGDVFLLIWGTTVGLTVAHLFAFQVSARLVAEGRVRRHDTVATIAQLAGAIAVALLATVPVVLLPTSSELDVVRIVLAGFITGVGFAVARGGGASTGRAARYAFLVLLMAGTIVALKNFLIGH